MGLRGPKPRPESDRLSARVVARLLPEERAELRRRAARRGISPAALLREWVRARLARAVAAEVAPGGTPL